MSVLEVINKKPLSLAEMSAELKKLEKRDGELNFRAKKVRDYLDAVKPVDVKAAKALEEKILALDIPRLKPQHVAKLVDLKPADMDELKTLFSAENITIKQEDLDKILSAIKE